MTATTQKKAMNQREQRRWVVRKQTGWLFVEGKLEQLAEQLSEKVSISTAKTSVTT